MTESITVRPGDTVTVYVVVATFRVTHPDGGPPIVNSARFHESGVRPLIDDQAIAKGEGIIRGRWGDLGLPGHPQWYSCESAVVVATVIRGKVRVIRPQKAKPAGKS